jgi:hypothetical protein
MALWLPGDDSGSAESWRCFGGVLGLFDAPASVDVIDVSGSGDLNEACVAVEGCGSSSDEADDDVVASRMYSMTSHVCSVASGANDTRRLASDFLRASFLLATASSSVFSFTALKIDFTAGIMADYLRLERRAAQQGQGRIPFCDFQSLPSVAYSGSQAPCSHCGSFWSSSSLEMARRGCYSGLEADRLQCSLCLGRNPWLRNSSCNRKGVAGRRIEGCHDPRVCLHTVLHVGLDCATRWSVQPSRIKCFSEPDAHSKLVQLICSAQSRGR